MVTTTGTSSSQEALRLFEEAFKRAKAAIVATDDVEQRVEALSVDLILQAIKAVIPALKLVDRDIQIRDCDENNLSGVLYLRGIYGGIPKTIWSRFILTRDGVLYRILGPTMSRKEDGAEKMAEGEEGYRHHFSSDYLIEQRMIVLGQLAEIFAKAMTVNERRHAKMQELKVRLEAAAAAFKLTDKPVS